MSTTTVGVKLNSDHRDRLKNAAQMIERTPHWVIKQLVLGFIERSEQGAGIGHLVNLADQALSEQQILEAIPEVAEHVFLEFAESILPQTVMSAAITSAYRRPENEAVPMMLEQARLSEPQAAAATKMALGIAEKLRNQKSGSGRQGLVQGLLQEFSLSSQEGVALMCLAEALLRIPDKATRDALIRDKISNGNWSQHLGQSPSMFVNAASWGLLITGKLVSTHNESGMTSNLNRIIGKSGEPLIRKAVDMAMRLMGEQFVTGETIGQALANSVKMENQGFRYSYDMLGEAALTDEDARRYLASYEQAIHTIGKASQGRGIYEGPGISIKLSALHPRYNRA
ncbi:proline dehydrogenase family protein, partial [Pseudomonas viridiflava]|uniref:proline dehydrogenase family protein n=1 Tax=Pseudomonas viridiflava TaxID=33069 RepID=UPI0019D2058A